MNELQKIQSHHLNRGAYLYIRQSSMRQVIENIEYETAVRVWSRDRTGLAGRADHRH